MRKHLSILLIALFVLLAFAPTAIAQTNQAASDTKTAEQLTDDAVKLMRQDIRAERKKMVAANLPLTADEAVKFWPVYDSYVAEYTKIMDSRYALIKEYAQDYGSMTDAQANSFIERWIATDKAVSDLRLKWVPQIEKVISAKKTAMFFQIDRRLGLVVELQLASQIPLVQP